MNGENLYLLNNIISSKKKTNDLLEKQILENEDEFENFDENFQNYNNENDNNGINIDMEHKITFNNNNYENNNNNNINNYETFNNNNNNENLDNNYEINYENNNINIELSENKNNDYNNGYSNSNTKNFNYNIEDNNNYNYGNNSNIYEKNNGDYDNNNNNNYYYETKKDNHDEINMESNDRSLKSLEFYGNESANNESSHFKENDDNTKESKIETQINKENGTDEGVSNKKNKEIKIVNADSNKNLNIQYNKDELINKRIVNNVYNEYKKEEKNSKKAKNKRKNKNLVKSNSMDFLEIDKKKMINEDNSDTTFSNFYKKTKKNKKHYLNKSIDYNIHRRINNDNNIIVNDRVNIYQRIFDTKMKNILESAKRDSKLKSNYNFYISQKRLNNYINNQEMFSDEALKEKLNKKRNFVNSNINNSNINIYHNKNKDSLEEDLLSIKSKKSKGKRKNSLNTSMSNRSERFNQTYERFLENQIKHKEKIEFLKKQKEEREKEIYYFSPKINKKSEKIKDDFHTRQQKRLEEQQKKYEILKLKIRKKEEEDINRNNILTKNKTSDMNKKRKLSDVSASINKLYEWDDKRKKRLQARQKSVDELRKKEYSHKPKIDKNSKKIMLNLQKYLYFKGNDIDNGVRTGHYINASIKEGAFDKLYKDELIKRTERQKALAQIYSPKFSPKVYKFNSNANTNTNTNNKNNTENANEENNKNKKDIRMCNNVYKVNNMKNKGNNNVILIGEYNNKNNINESDNYQNCYINNDSEKQIKSRFFEKLSNTKSNGSIDLNEEIKKEISKGKNKGNYNGNVKYSNSNKEKNIKDNIYNNYQKLTNNINDKNKNYEIRVHLNDRKEYLSNGKDKKRYRNKSVDY